MALVEVPAHEVRLSKRAASALAERQTVAVTRYGRRSHVVVSTERFALVEPLLELLDGGTVPFELLLTTSDLELERLLAEDREPSQVEQALVDELLTEPAAD